MLAQAYWHKQAREARPMAFLLQAFWNVNRDTDRRPEPFEFGEVMEVLGYPLPKTPPPQPTVEELRERITVLHGVYSATVNGTDPSNNS